MADFYTLTMDDLVGVEGRFLRKGDFIALRKNTPGAIPGADSYGMVQLTQVVAKKPEFLLTYLLPEGAEIASGPKTSIAVTWKNEKHVITITQAVFETESILCKRR